MPAGRLEDRVVVGRGRPLGARRRDRIERAAPPCGGSTAASRTSGRGAGHARPSARGHPSHRARGAGPPPSYPRPRRQLLPSPSSHPSSCRTHREERSDFSRLIASSDGGMSVSRFPHAKNIGIIAGRCCDASGEILCVGGDAPVADQQAGHRRSVSRMPDGDRTSIGRVLRDTPGRRLARARVGERPCPVRAVRLAGRPPKLSTRPARPRWQCKSRRTWRCSLCLEAAAGPWAALAPLDCWDLSLPRPLR